MKEHNYDMEQQNTVSNYFLKERRTMTGKEKLADRVTKNVKVELLKLSKEVVHKMDLIEIEKP